METRSFMPEKTVANQNVLFLQGPMGPFFAKMEAALRPRAASTHRIGFNGGDRVFSRKESYVPYTGTLGEWPLFFRNYLKKHNIGVVFLFGDCRDYHLCAVETCREAGIRLFVFEEGYLRPNYITMEPGGVNGFSRMPRNSVFYRNVPESSGHSPSAGPIRFPCLKMGTYAALYFLAAALMRFHYPHYRHHRNFSPLKEAFFGIRSLVRKVGNRFREKSLSSRIGGELNGSYHLALLQTRSDFQLRVHSPFNSMEEYIRRVTASFAKNGDPESFLVFKSHPMDRGRIDYTRFIRREAKALGIGNRVLLVHDIPLPRLFKHARGVVTINSTAGLSALHHNLPLAVLGTAIYDLEGLTFRGSLDRFWSDGVRPDGELFRKFKEYLLRHNQYPGSFYAGYPQGLFPAPSRKPKEKSRSKQSVLPSPGLTIQTTAESGVPA